MTPQKVADISYPIEQIYEDMTDELLLNIAKHLNSPTSTWTALREIELTGRMGQLTEENTKIINSYVRKIPQAVLSAMNESRQEALSEIENKLAQAALNGQLIEPVTDSTIEVAKAFSQQAISQLNMVNQTMLDSSLVAYHKGVDSLRLGMSSIENAYELQQAQNIVDLAAGQVAIGTETRTGALRKALKTLNQQGITGFYDKRGRGWSAEAYVNMDIRTTVHNTYIQSVKSRQKDYGSDVFQVSAHAGARPLCYPYQGKMYSWGTSGGTITLGDGRRYRFESINVTSYGKPAGLFGINCGHVPYPMIAGVSEPIDEKIQSKEENDKEYRESQEQRSLEREIRDRKRELAMLGDLATDEDKRKLKYAQAKMRAFIDDTGRTRRYDREQIVTEKDGYSKVTVKGGAKPNPTKNNQTKPNGSNKVASIGYTQLKSVMESENIAYKDVKDRKDGRADTVTAYKAVAGGDRTEGSCVSAALSYIGQISGWDVRDFRGGESRHQFALNVNNRKLKRLSGVSAVEEQAKTSIEAGKKLVKKIDEGKQYLLIVGRHASIVRRNTAGEMMYLELQSPIIKGWQVAYNEENTLRRRFGCNDESDNFNRDGFLIDVEQLRGNQELRDLLGYINTDEKDEQKGYGGSTK